MDKPKVMFIEPMGAKSNVYSDAMTIPLLGVVYLATIAKQVGYPVRIINENILGRRISPSELGSADILCVSCLTTTVERGKEIAKQYKLLNPGGKTMIGGIHASMIPQDVVNHFDQVIVGEGENIILDILSGKIKDKIVYGKMTKDLDSIPIPDFKLIKGWRNITTIPVMTSRGCPYACNFCSVTEMFGRGYRAQSPKRVIEELLRYKKGRIFFSDDHFVANPKRTEEILDLMIDYGFDRPWMAQVRTEITKNPKLVAKMKEAGCIFTCIGFESINPQSLKDMNKGQSVEDIKRSINVFHDNGIEIHGMFILGSDSDTKETFKKTADFCHKNRIDFVQYMALTPLPGTEFYRKLERENRILHKKWNFYDGLHVVFKPKNMSANELQQGMIGCFNDFYSYTNAVNEALNTAVGAAVAMVKKAYTKAYLPSYRPFAFKLLGKKKINDWLKYNKGYLRYMKGLSNIRSTHQLV